ncbi:hypothetical protein [Neobacillus mesonae]|uniref:Uncharacterized protein n=1 Tax=Neobacillus mesonae TaxID=1193713 RepID=A0A3T0HTS7_9BACI|nr:hypothetical protein [Neobacillus mesonae]AZU60461.1 hypothetical protein CHR53_03820 [Neobacillus mesonae]
MVGWVIPKEGIPVVWKEYLYYRNEKLQIKEVKLLSLFNFPFNKVLVYTALNNDDYFKVAYAFQKEGLYYKVKMKSRDNSPSPQNFSVSNDRAPVIYDFYVKKEDQHKAELMISTVR